MSNQEIVAVVKDLLRAIEKISCGFSVAIEAAGNADMKLLLAHYLQQCGRFLAELREMAAALGEPAEEIAGAPPPDVFTDGDFITLLAQCEREEDHVMNEYRRAITLPLPSDVLHTVEAQGLEIKAAHDKLKYLSHLAQAA